MNIKSTTPKSLAVLKAKITNFHKKIKPSLTNPISPRYFRVYIGVSKQTLSNWKMSESKKPWFDLIKKHEDILLSFIEQMTISLSLVGKDQRVNLIGLLNTLRAYDSEQYIPELRQEQQTTSAPIKIVLHNDSNNKIAIPAKTKEKHAK